MSFTVKVWVKAGSTQGPKLEVGKDAQLIVYVQEPARNGQANEAVRKVLAKHFHTSASSITLHKGSKARYKTFTVRS